MKWKQNENKQNENKQKQINKQKLNTVSQVLRFCEALVGSRSVRLIAGRKPLQKSFSEKENTGVDATVASSARGMSESLPISVW